MVCFEYLDYRNLIEEELSLLVVDINNRINNFIF